MTKVVFLGLESFDFFNQQDVFNYSFGGIAVNGAYLFRNPDGQLVTVEGDNLTVNFGRFVAGTVTSITIAPTGNDAAVNLEFTQLSLDGTLLFGSNGAGIPGNTAKWLTVLDGDVDLETRGSAGLDFALDGTVLTGGSTVSGGDNSATGDFGPGSDITGGIEQVFSSAQFFGGRFEFEGQAPRVAGDSLLINSGAAVYGGDDRLIYDRGTDFPNLLTTSNLTWSGDVVFSIGDTTLIGGNDHIDMSDAETDANIFIYGDIVQSPAKMVIVGGNDVLIGAKNVENQISGDMDDVLEDQVFAGGNDTIYGGDKADVLYGDHVGDDTGNNGGDDSIFGGDGDDSIYGNAGDDALFDALGEGQIFGGEGDDTFKPLEDGSHTFFGGDGIDTLDYSASSAKVIIDLADQTVTGGWGADDVFTSVEVARGSQRGDTLFGTSGEDSLFGDKGNDSLDGGDGDDMLVAGRGEDQLVSGEGSDAYFGGKGFDVLDYRGSDAGIRVKLDKNKFSGGHADGDSAKGVENIFGSEFNDKLRGDKKANFTRGRDGEDVIRGLKGSDKLAGQKGGDDIFGGKGSDRVSGGKGKDELYGGKGADRLFGGKGKDEFHFKRGDDYDLIRDFQNNRDTLVLKGVGNNPLSNAEQVGKDVYINFGKGDQLYIEDITIAQLRDDIEFG